MTHANISRDTMPMRHGQVWVQRDSDRTAVFNPDSGLLHLLNSSALAIWELCDGETSPAEMAEAIDVITGLGADTTTADVERTLRSLEDAGLIHFPNRPS